MVCEYLHMENITAPKTAGRRLAALVEAEGSSMERVSQATDIPVTLLREGNLTLDELTDVGGLFCVSPDRFMEDE